MNVNIEYFEKIAAQLVFPTRPYINGSFQDSESNETIHSINPATSQVISSIHACEQSDLDRTVHAAKQVFEQGSWSSLHPSMRKASLLKLAKLILDNKEELAVLESLESGKPITDCLEVDVPETAKCISWFAEACDKIYDNLSPSGADHMGMIVKEPIGVVATVLPWNYPLMMLAWKIAPALAAGNSVIAKPSELTSMTALRLAELASEAGLPDGVFNVLPGYGETLGKSIGMHMDIDVVSFTGSTVVGRKFLEYSAASNLKEITLECGGKSPSIILSDAQNLDAIAGHVTHAAFTNMGQNCCANSRLIVHHSLKEELLERIQKHAQAWKVGAPLDPNNKLGAMVSASHYDKVLGYINQGIQEGAKLVRGGQAIQNTQGFYIEPTIFDDVTPDMVIAQEEMFGPILCVMSVESDNDAITLANQTPYGLQASLYSSHLGKAIIQSKKIKAGTISINCYGEGDSTTPFGGLKASGFGGKDNSLSAFDQYLQTKTIWVDMTMDC